MSASSGERIDRKANASVVLRRQVPIRFDEPARSWLGGLPQMPDNIPWPRTTGNGAPLHFIAQIACADLPKQIWNGRGPRDGWLLLFVDVLQMEDSGEEEPDIDNLGDVVRYYLRRAGFGGGGFVQMLHVNRLGSERQPPEDMPTVRHVMSDYIGRFTPVFREGVPKLWRRWPVDIVVQEVPPPPAEGSGTEWEPLQISGAELYGAPVVDERIENFADTERRPLTWRGALYLVDGIKAALAEHVHYYLLTPPSSEPGWLAAKIAETEKHLASCEVDAAKTAAALNSSPKVAPAPEITPAAEETTPAPEELTPEQRAWCEQRIVILGNDAAVHRRGIADLSFFSNGDGEAALAAEIVRTGEAHAKWRMQQPQVLDALRTRILSQDLEAPLGADDWSALKAELTASTTEYWNDWSYGERKVRRSLLGYGDEALKVAQREDVLDLYTGSAAARAAIPPGLLAELEPKLRNIGISYAPHRMGGPRDCLQGWASPGDDDLLFQIFSDDAMGWVWGDLGAVFVYLKPSRRWLWRWWRWRGLNHVYAWLDGH